MSSPAVSFSPRNFRVLFLAILGGISLLSQSAHAQTLDDGNRAFAEGRFAQSTAAFQAVLAQKGYSAPVLFDLGNSLTNQGDFGNAILSYKRALWLAPDDGDVMANLRLAERRAGVPETKLTLPEKFASELSANAWTWLGSAAWLILCLSIVGTLTFPQFRAPSRLAAVLSATCLLTAIVGMAIRSASLHEGVIIARGASALVSPFSGAGVAFAPPPGQTVAMEKTYGNFWLVRDGLGHRGWVPANQVAITIPPR